MRVRGKREAFPPVSVPTHQPGQVPGSAGPQFLTSGAEDNTLCEGQCGSDSRAKMEAMRAEPPA